MIRIQTKLCLLKSVATSAIFAMAISAATAQEYISFNIEEQSLATALIDFSEQSGLMVASPRALIEGKQATAVMGEMSCERALEQILLETGLQVYAVDEGVYTIRAAKEEPSAAPFRTPEIRTVAAEESEPSSPSLVEKEVDELQRQETVVVTGSRRDGRTVLQSAVPIDVLSSDQLIQGATDTNEVLRTLVPSFSVRQVSVGGGTPFIRPPTLRGLPPDQILVLVNSKRRHRSALVNLAGGGALAQGAQATDLATIPSIAIKQVEVLRDGASAQYGSDAIAGVLNFILKDSNEGATISSQWGETYSGDGESFRLQGNIGLPLSENGFINISGEFSTQDPTQRGTDPLPSLAAFTAITTNAEDLVEIETQQPRWGTPRSQALRFFVNGGLDLTDDDELYFFGNYSDAFSSNRFVYRTITNTAFRQSAVDPSFDLTDVYPFGFTPRFSADLFDMSGAAGIRGTLFDKANYDVSATLGRNKMEYEIGNTFNPSLGYDSPTTVDVGDLIQTETAVEGEIVYPFEVGFSSPLSTAFGIEFRHQGYEITVGDEGGYIQGPLSDLLIGTSGVASQSPTDAGLFNQDSTSAYVDLETDITSNWLMNVAVRYDDYSDFGDTVNGKLATRLEINDAFALRSSVSTGFRAPTPGQSRTNNTQTGFQGEDPITIQVIPPSSAAAQYFGAEDLTPEESINYAFGFTAEPLADLALTVDFYRIDVEDRIALSGQITLTDEDRVTLAGLGVAGADAIGRVQFFTNTFDTKTEGVDVVATYSRDFGSYGSADFTLAYNHNETEVTKIDDPSIINSERKLEIEESVPNDTAVFTTNYQNGPFSGMLRFNYFGGWTDQNILIQDFSSALLTDLELSYAFNDQYRFALGATNLFDEFPDELESPVFSQIFGLVYPTSSPFGYNGGTYYARLTAEF